MTENLSQSLVVECDSVYNLSKSYFCSNKVEVLIITDSLNVSQAFLHLLFDWALPLVSILGPFNTILGRILQGHFSQKPPPLISNQIHHLLPLESDQAPYQIKFLILHLRYFITLARLQQETYQLSVARIFLPLLLEHFHSLLPPCSLAINIHLPLLYLELIPALY